VISTDASKLGFGGCCARAAAAPKNTAADRHDVKRRTR
jgi:hypothetical protein